jgi:hypothetical protein
MRPVSVSQRRAAFVRAFGGADSGVLAGISGPVVQDLMGARRIFIELGLASREGDSSRGFRGLLQQLMESFSRENLAALLSLETGKAPDSIAAVEMTDFLADTASSWAGNDVKS